MIPLAFLISLSLLDPWFAIIIVVLIGVLITLWFRLQARESKAIEQREQAVAALDITQEKLRSQVRNTMRYQDKLVALTNISALLGQSLELEAISHAGIDMIMEFMEVEAVMIFTLDKGKKRLMLVAHEGISQESTEDIKRIDFGEDLSGWIAKTGEPRLIKDVPPDFRVANKIMKRENLKAGIIVPMKSRGKVMGTVCLATHKDKEFSIEEIELFTTIANEVGVAIENANLYRKQVAMTEQLSQSERYYRELFKSAQDAIWIQNLLGFITDANEAGEIMTGYSREELSGADVRKFLAPESLKVAKEVRRCLLSGERLDQPYDQRVIRKDGSEAYLKLSTSLITVEGKPISFQHIGRDVSQERRMQENLRFYIQQITKAQEKERLRIAQELHDSTAQSLITLLHQLDGLLHDKAGLPMSEARNLWGIHEGIKDILQEVRYLSRDLRPSILDDVGLLPALQWMTRELRAECEIETDLQVHGIEQRFSPEAEVLLFRIVQEALRNAARHAQASMVKVNIEFSDAKITTTVEDNGKGFELPENIGDLSRTGKLGLVGMQERAQLLGGSLRLQSELGKGTTIIVEAPIMTPGH
jgi:PAS domain S-box-containing protein